MAADDADDAIGTARRLVLDRFRWADGHADVWAVLRDAAALRAVVRGLAAPFAGVPLSAVVGVESRGFLLGAAVAVELGVGFVPVRKAGGLFPGAGEPVPTAPDYRGIVHRLRIQPATLAAGDWVVAVDDWVETGSQLRAVNTLLSELGVDLVATSVIVDDTSPPSRAGLGPLHALLTSAELPSSR